jgi:hypothetical protein
MQIDEGNNQMKEQSDPMNTSSIENKVEEEKSQDVDMQIDQDRNSMRKSLSSISPSKSVIERTKGEGGIIADTFFG